MLDPGALGTLLIGLEAVRRDADGSGPTRPERPRRTKRAAARLALAAALRRVANALEPERVAVAGCEG